MGRAVPAGAPALPRQRDLKCKHEKEKRKKTEKRKEKKEDLIDACFGNGNKQTNSTTRT